jgi:hypothetical protein
MKCPLALSLRVIPIPSRITRKSTRPRASDRSMCCQPGNRHGLSASETDRHRRYSIRMQPRWTMQDPRHDPNTSPHVQGAGRQGNLFSFRSRHKNVLDILSHRMSEMAMLQQLRRLILQAPKSCTMLVLPKEPPRITRNSYRPRASDRTMVDFESPFAGCSRKTRRRR